MDTMTPEDYSIDIARDLFLVLRERLSAVQQPPEVLKDMAVGIVGRHADGHGPRQLYSTASCLSTTSCRSQRQTHRSLYNGGCQSSPQAARK